MCRKDTISVFYPFIFADCKKGKIKTILKIFYPLICLVLITGGCRKKETFAQDASDKLAFSTDSVLFDTVFTTIGSATRNFRILNNNSKPIRISSIRLERTNSPFFLNVDGEPGKKFSNIEVGPRDSIYVFVQVNINPNGGSTEIIENDRVIFNTNGNEQSVVLEAWGQDAYYHYPTRAIKFSDGSYLPYSLVDTLQNSYTMVGDEFVWKNDKPHVIYGFLVVDSLQKLRIPAGTEVYLNYKAGIWVYRYGQIRVLGKKGNEVHFQGARRERDFADDPGQWDRIWINEGSDQNVIDYAIIKNGYIGVQAELFNGADTSSGLRVGLNIQNTIIQNMSMWGLYGLAFNVSGFNNVISNCQEHSINLTLGGSYEFYHCTFANFWKKGKVREKSTLRLNNYTELQVIPNRYFFGNCIIDGSRENELDIDLKSGGGVTPSYTFSSCWVKTNINTGTANYISVQSSTTSLEYDDIETYKFALDADEQRASGFSDPLAVAVTALFPRDILLKLRNGAAGSITAGAYEK